MHIKYCILRLEWVPNILFGIRNSVLNIVHTGKRAELYCDRTTAKTGKTTRHVLTKMFFRRFRVTAAVRSHVSVAYAYNRIAQPDYQSNPFFVDVTFAPVRPLPYSRPSGGQISNGFAARCPPTRHERGWGGPKRNNNFGAKTRERESEKEKEKKNIARTKYTRDIRLGSWGHDRFDRRRWRTLQVGRLRIVKASAAYTCYLFRPR